MKSVAVRIFLVLFIAFPVFLLEIQLYSQDKSEIEGMSRESAQAGAGFEMKYVELRLQMDADRDEIITQDEWSRLFDKIDENGDKRLSDQEMQKVLNNGEAEVASDWSRMAAFNQLDGNGDGTIDLSEWPEKGKGKRKPASFLYLDMNRDDSLSRKEFTSQNSRWWNQLFENIDLDKNGLIIPEEWMDSNASFDRLDRSQDGAISHSEFYNPR